MAKQPPKIAIEDFASVARLFTVLAEPARLMILHLLKHRSACVGQVVAHTGLKQSNASKHLAMLYDVGLLDRRRDGNQILYSVRDPLVFNLCNLVCHKLHRDAESQVDALSKVAG